MSRHKFEDYTDTCRGMTTPMGPVYSGAGSSMGTPIGASSSLSTPIGQSIATPIVQPDAIPVPGNVLRLSRSQQGGCEVHTALLNAPSDDGRTAIAAEFRGHVVKVVKCINAHHVLQRCIMTTSPQSSQFILDELLELGPGLCKIAKHKCGCRVFQRLIEHSSPAQLRGLVEYIILDAQTLARHLFGTYVVQCLLQHGTQDQRRRIVLLLLDHAELMGMDTHGSAILSAALCHASEADSLLLAQALLSHPGLLVTMARTRRGHGAVINVLDALDGREGSAETLQQLSGDIDTLRACRYGKFVVARSVKMMT